MPCIGSADGLTFYVYADDHNPPHLHAYCGDDSVLISLASGKVIAGTMKVAKLEQAQRWLADNRRVAQAAWNRLNP